MKLVYLDIFPSDIEDDVLYISKLYSTSAHKCADGCGYRVVLPLGKGGWLLQDDNEDSFSLTPSVHVETCNSHYWIVDGGIDWAREMTRDEARRYSEKDQRSYNQEITSKGLLKRIWETFQSWFKTR